MVSRLHLLLLLLVAVPVARPDVRSDQEKRLKEVFAGKILTIRDFYVDNELVYSPAAKVIVGGRSGDWTLAHLNVEKIRLHPDRLTFEGHRVRVLYDKDADDVFRDQQSGKIKIEIQLDPSHSTDADLMDLLSHVFLTKSDKLEQLVPEAWKPIIHRQELWDIPNGSMAGATGRIGGAIKAPRVRTKIDPAYPPYAREQRVQGSVVLWMVVDTDGRVKHVRVAKSVCCGLDEQAVAAIRQWKFDPATNKDGKPVAVQLNVEINFRLF